MKTIMITAIAVLCAVETLQADIRSLEEIRTGYAADVQKNPTQRGKKFLLGLSVAEWRLLADEFLGIAATNYPQANALRPNVEACLTRYSHWGTKALDIADYFDEKFYSFNKTVTPRYYKYLPKSAEAWLNSGDKIVATWVKNHSFYVSRTRKYKDGDAKNAFTFPEFLNYVHEYSACTDSYVVPDGRLPERLKRLVLIRAPRAIKRALRSTGQTFVVGKGGKNPVQDALDELSTALNAPKFEGLKEWVAKYFPDYKWVDTPWMTDEAIKELKDAIYYGEKDFNGFNRSLLETALGVDAFNEFVKEYNGPVE